MAPRSKKASAPSKARKPKKNKTLVVVQCKANEGKTPCLARNMAGELLAEALASTVWKHREDMMDVVEFVISEASIVPTGRAKGHFELGVSVVRLDQQVYDDEQALEMPLHKFLQTFVPVREINVQDCQA